MTNEELLYELITAHSQYKDEPAGPTAESKIPRIKRAREAVLSRMQTPEQLADNSEVYLWISPEDQERRPGVREMEELTRASHGKIVITKEQQAAYRGLVESAVIAEQAIRNWHDSPESLEKAGEALALALTKVEEAEKP